MVNNSIYSINEHVRESGLIGTGYIKDEGKVRFMISNCGPANVIRVRARILSESEWVTIATFTSNVNELINVYGYDNIEVSCLVFDPLDGVGFRIQASSFNANSLFVFTPGGALEGAPELILTSSDGSVSIIANSLTQAIDFRVTPSGGGSSLPYVKTVNIDEWSLNGDNYELVILAEDHFKGVNPIVQVYEYSDSKFEKIITGMLVNAIGDITLTAQETPDLRFEGKVIIS